MSDHNVVWTPLRLFSHILFILHLQFSTGGLAPGISGLAPMCTRPYTSFLQSSAFYVMGYFLRVNALSGLYLISTEEINNAFGGGILCQCPLGLIPHFYKSTLGGRSFCKQVSMPSRAYTSFLRSVTFDRGASTSICQCPLGLIPHFYAISFCVIDNIDGMVSMPSRAYTSFLQD